MDKEELFMFGFPMKKKVHRESTDGNQNVESRPKKKIVFIEDEEINARGAYCQIQKAIYNKVYEEWLRSWPEIEIKSVFIGESGKPVIEISRRVSSVEAQKTDSQIEEN